MDKVVKNVLTYSKRFFSDAFVLFNFQLSIDGRMRCRLISVALSYFNIRDICNNLIYTGKHSRLVALVDRNRHNSSNILSMINMNYGIDNYTLH